MTNKDLAFFQEHGYWADREQRLRDIAGDREDSLSMESANQIKHLKTDLSETAAWIAEAIKLDSTPEWVKVSGKSIVDRINSVHELAAMNSDEGL
jgi:hypothetical protein